MHSTSTPFKAKTAQTARFDRSSKRMSLLFAFILISSFILFLNQAWAVPDFTNLVKRAAPAVVAIKVLHKSEKSAAGLPDLQGLPNQEEIPEFFRRFFEQIPKNQQQPERQARGQGSGFIISADGYVLTNHHVVREAEEVIVSLSDRREFKAKVIGSDARTDVAVLKLDAKDLPTVTLGDSDKLEVGQWLLAIGSPFGFDYTATQGIVSALSRSLPDETYVPFIQTDVAVNPGNSGGPLFNESGEVIGINAQIYSRTGGYMGLSFAIPINVALEVSQQLRQKGYVSRGWLGVTIQDLDRALAESFGMDRPSGALVSNVSKDSPADKAGVKNGDVIVAYEDKPITRSGDLPPLVGATPIGKRVKLKVLRDAKSKNITVRIGELETEKVAKTEKPSEPTSNDLGIVTSNLSKEQLEALSGRGVLVEDVSYGGPAASSGIVPGDVILSFNHKDVKNVSALTKLIKSAPREQPIAVLVQRERGSRFLALTLPKS